MGVKSLVGCLLVAVVVVAGVITPPVPSNVPTISPNSQRLFCGDGLDQATCEAAVAAVVRAVAENAASAVAVVGPLSPPSPASAANSTVDDRLLVSFAPLAGEDVWLNPPTWTVSSADTIVEPWRAEQWPPHYVTLLVQAGLVGDAPAD